MNAYTINTRTKRVLGRFDTIENADKAGIALTTDNYIVVTDEQDIGKLMNRQDMVDCYNAATGASLKKFSTKADGAKRLFATLEDLELGNILPEPSVKKKAAKKGPVEKGYRGHRAGSKKADAHEKFDTLFAQDKTRPEIVAAMVECGVQENTARSWYQAFRRTYLAEKTA